jgi:soluble lytic murein transglycosylase
VELRLRSVVGATGLLAFVFGLISLTLEGAGPTPGTAAADPPHVVAPAEPAPTSEPLDPAYETAARALRARRCTEAQQAIAPLIAAASTPAIGELGSARRALLASGLYAHACEDVALAEERLAAAAEPGAELEDWRLLLLAESAHARGDDEAAHRALAELLSDYRDSPLWERALVAAIEQSAEAGDPEHALQLVRWSREQEALSPETIARAEALAWQVGRELNDLTVQARAARRLLTYAPMTASELRVVELFRRPGGDVAWRAILTDAELQRRAAALLGSGLIDGALTTLADVPAHERGFEWTLLQARALSRSGRGREAEAVLRATTPTDPEERVAVEWALAQAYADLAAPLSGGARLSVDAREGMRRAAHEHLAAVVRIGADLELSAQALRQLFGDRVAENRFEEALETLRVLRRMDPGDTTGTAHLWGLGWQEYRKENYSGAIGYWSELVSLYPESRESRSGRYWTARAFERLGDDARARSVLREIATSDTTDFYRKQALARLDDGDGLAAAARATAEGPASEQPWPVDEDLGRAQLLSDLGLDELALAEIEARGEAVDRRAREALTGMALARQGRYRAGIPHLRRAFPALGGPYQASVPREARRLYYPLAFEEQIAPAAGLAGVPPHLVYGIIREESAFDITATSHVGARGLMQLMPATGREIAGRIGLRYRIENLDDPGYNVRLGASYFGQLLEMFDGRTELALAGYNGGPYRMKRLWRLAGPRPEMDFFLESLPIDESRNYVKRVLVFSDSYERMYGM